MIPRMATGDKNSDNPKEHKEWSADPSSREWKRETLVN